MKVKNGTEDLPHDSPCREFRKVTTRDNMIKELAVSCELVGKDGCVST